MIDGDPYVHIPFCQEKNVITFVILCPDQKPLRPGGLFNVAGAGRGLPTATSQRRKSGLSTIFFGGGTPITAPSRRFCIFVGLLSWFFRVSTAIWDRCEANPEGIGGSYCKKLSSLGINRIPFGAQAFQDHLPKAMGRRHRSDDIAKAVSLAKGDCFSNVNLDLIYGLPGQTMADWGRVWWLRHRCPSLISTYGLKNSPRLLPGDSGFRQGIFPYPMRISMQICSFMLYGFPGRGQGIHRYEIANFAKSGFKNAVINSLIGGATGLFRIGIKRFFLAFSGCAD